MAQWWALVGAHHHRLIYRHFKIHVGPYAFDIMLFLPYSFWVLQSILRDKIFSVLVLLTLAGSHCCFVLRWKPVLSQKKSWRSKASLMHFMLRRPPEAGVPFFNVTALHVFWRNFCGRHQMMIVCMLQQFLMYVMNQWQCRPVHMKIHSS